MFFDINCFFIFIPYKNISTQGYFFVHNHFLRYCLILFGFLQKHNALSFPRYSHLAAQRLTIAFDLPTPPELFPLELKTAF